MNCLLTLFVLCWWQRDNQIHTSGLTLDLFTSCNDAVSQLLSCHGLRFRSFAYTFRCSRGQTDICTKMTTPSQLGTLRGKIEKLEAEILKIEEALAAAQASADVAFLRQQLGDLLLRRQQM